MRFRLSFFSILVLFGIATHVHAFTDVYNHPWSTYEAINYLKDGGIVQGYSDGTFRPYQTINRAEFLKLLIDANYYLNQGEGEMLPWGDRNCVINIDDETRNALTDVEFGSWYSGYVCYALFNDIIDGYPDGTIRPSRTINFVEATKIIANVFELNPVQGTSPWYKGYVVLLASRNVIPLSISSFSQEITRGEMAEMIHSLLTDTHVSSRTYDDLVGIVDVSGKSPQDLISALNTTDWTDKILLDTLCAVAKRSDIVAVTGGENPPCDGMQAYKWHEWLDQYWPQN